jgi:hypothetical protein
MTLFHIYHLQIHQNQSDFLLAAFTDLMKDWHFLESAAIRPSGGANIAQLTCNKEIRTNHEAKKNK